MQRIDLHIHTTASDGTMTPTEIVTTAKSLGLSAIAITDHDTSDGVPEALAAGKACGLEVIPGIEISVDYLGYAVHLLGYFVDPHSDAMKKLLEWTIDERKFRNRAVARKMQDDGIDIRVEELKEQFPDSVVGRPHFAAALVEKGHADSIEDAFRRYLDEGRPYFMKRIYTPIDLAFAVIRESGGKAVIAHPLQYGFSEPELLTMIRTMKDAGAIGMECQYFGYSPEQVAYLEGLAKQFDLCITGGSDFHGTRKPQIVFGQLDVPYSLLENLKLR